MSGKALQNRELQEHYEDLFSTFGTRGWKRIQEQIDEMIQSNSTLAGVDTVEQLWFRKGELSMMFWLRSFADMSEATYNDLRAQQEGGDAQKSTGGKAKITGGADEDGPLS